MILRTYGGVTLEPPATSIAEAERRWRQALAAGDQQAAAFQLKREKKAKAFSHAVKCKSFNHATAKSRDK